MASQLPQLKIGDYHLVRLLGKGGMGEVWLASDIRADRPVAVKFIKPGYLDDPAMRTRFLNEAKTLGRLEQDRIVTLYNVVEDGANLALVLRFIDGSSLADRIDSEGALPLDFVLSSARDILPALGFAHEHGVIHRDIKPQNVLLDRHSRSFLTDFGIAVGDFAERGTVTGFAVGTPHYMSPEQIQTPRQISVQNRGHRSDIYSYGVVLYEMLTGRVPFCGDSGVEEVYKVQHAHCVEPPPKLREVNPQVPAAVEDLVLRSLAKDPDDRPQSCADFLRQFEAAVVDGSSVVRSRSPSSARAATIVEKGPSVERPPAAPAPRVEAARPAVQQRSRGLSKAAWLSIGAFVIAGSISYAIISSKAGSPQPETKDPPAAQTIPPVSPPKVEKSVSPPPDTGGSGSARSIRNVTPPPKVVSPVTPTVDPLAERAYSQALDFQRKGMPCEGLGPANDAAKRDSTNQKYPVLQAQMKKDCEVVQGAGNYYEQAKLQFEQGNYCEGKNAIDQAVHISPSNKTYLELQQRLRKGCNIP